MSGCDAPRRDPPPVFPAVSFARLLRRRSAVLGRVVVPRLRWLRRAGRLMAEAAWRGLVDFYNSDDLTHAAAIAYYALLSLFPFLLLALAVLGGVAADVADRAVVLRFVLRYFPTQLDFVSRQLDAFAETRVPIGLGGGLALTWAALAVCSAISSAVNHAWGVEQPRGYVKHKLVSFAMLVAAGLLLLLALALVSASHIVEASWFAGVVDRFPALRTLHGVALRQATALMLIGVVGLIFYFVPNASVRFRDVWVGAALTGLLWKGALEGFSWYVRDMARFSVHGSIAAVVVFLMWIYLSAVILLYGVEFTAAYARLRGRETVVSRQ